MTLPSSTIAMTQIRNEFSQESSPGSGPLSLSAYRNRYVNSDTVDGILSPGNGVPDVPTSGRISMSNFRGAYQQLANRPSKNFQDGGTPDNGRYAYGDAVIFPYVGKDQTFYFLNATYVYIQVWGAQGGGGGGYGGYAGGYYAGTGSLIVRVGGAGGNFAGGWPNGGRAAVGGNGERGNGGGSSDVRSTADASTRIIVGGGGGGGLYWGGGHWTGGAGGGENGGAGENAHSESAYGTGGTQSRGGAGFSGGWPWDANLITYGDPFQGRWDHGGDSVGLSNGFNTMSAGGGGYWGGGSGNGGGGGSGYIGGVSSGTMTNGLQSGNGLCKITIRG